MSHDPPPAAAPWREVAPSHTPDALVCPSCYGAGGACRVCSGRRSVPPHLSRDYAVYCWRVRRWRFACRVLVLLVRRFGREHARALRMHRHAQRYAAGAAAIANRYGARWPLPR